MSSPGTSTANDTTWSEPEPMDFFYFRLALHRCTIYADAHRIALFSSTLWSIPILHTPLAGLLSTLSEAKYKMSFNGE